MKGSPRLYLPTIHFGIAYPRRYRDTAFTLFLPKYRDTIRLVIAGHWHKWIDFAHTFGPQHYVMAATRYDPNAYMLMEADNRTQTVRFLNASLVEWSTHFSAPYVRQSPA